jgi:FdrA protein
VKVDVVVRRGAYHDSVTLMRVGRSLAALDGVVAAQSAMATELNRELLAEQGFEVPADAGPNDLVVAVRAVDSGALNRALDALPTLLTPAPEASSPGGLGVERPGRTTASAARRAPSATLALVSVPGPHAFAEAMDALAAGLNVLLFSDNVPVAQEIVLKEEAARRGLLVMGPDCGTAVVGGVGLGFANVVRHGPVGLVAASGTGSQQVMSLLDEAGVGISHALGVGGRDLSAEVSGRSTLQALTALDEDPSTELIVVVTKPPAPRVADLVREALRRLSTPTVFAPLGPGMRDLTATVEKVLALRGVEIPKWPVWPAPVPRTAPGTELRGLFAGGTLCSEASMIAGVPFTDFGDDAYTRGRAHPMIDPTLRLEHLAAATADPSCGVILLDVVLGHGAEPDPAARLAPLIEAAPQPVVVSLCGTAADPQDRDRQAAVLQQAGASVFASNAAAARHAVSLITPNTTERRWSQ